MNSRRQQDHKPGTVRLRTHVAMVAMSALMVTVSTAAPLNSERYPAPGKHVWIDKTRFHINCTGAGHPSVILDSGLGGSSLDWVKVQPKVAQFTKVCSYDRAGYGWSGRPRAPRTAENIVRELGNLLGGASVNGPYVLVGHSFGGLTARLFAHRHPNRTAGLVMVDASHERLFERLDQAGLGKPLAPTGGRFVISNHESLPAGLPAEAKRVARALALGPDSLEALYGELRFLRISAQQVQGAHTLPEVPLAVVARDGRQQAKTERGKAIARIWLELQRELAARTPDSSLLITPQSGHHIHLDQPHLVVGAIKGVVQAVRGRDRSCPTHTVC